MKQTKDIYKKSPCGGLSGYRITPVLIVLAAVALFSSCTFITGDGTSFSYYLMGTWKTNFSTSDKYKITIEISYNTIKISRGGTSTPAILNGITWDAYQDGYSSETSSGTLREGTIYFDDIGLGQQKSISYGYGKENYPGTKTILTLKGLSTSNNIVLYKDGNGSTYNYFNSDLQGTWKTNFSSSDRYKITVEIASDTILISKEGNYTPALLNGITLDTYQNGYSSETTSSSASLKEGTIYFDDIGLGQQKSIPYRYGQEASPGTKVILTLLGSSSSNNLTLYKQ